MLASIDIGTNTALLLIAETGEGHSLKVIREEHRVPRLGRGVDSNRRLHPDSMERVLKVLMEYREIIATTAARYGVEGIAPVVTATSAVRDAENRDEFMEMIERKTGWKLRLLSGDEEASATFQGALKALPAVVQKNYDHAVVLDIGGGSTETAFGRYQPGADPDHYLSVDAGCVRFTERYLKPKGPAVDELGYTPDAAQIKTCRAAAWETFSGLDRIRQQIRSIGDKERVLCVGVAGTVTSLAFMELALESYSSEVVNATMLSASQIKRWLQYASTSSPAKIAADYPEVMEGRADIVLAGLIIVDAFMDYMGMDEMMVSTGGIRHGVL